MERPIQTTSPTMMVGSFTSCTGRVYVGYLSLSRLSDDIINRPSTTDPFQCRPASDVERVDQPGIRTQAPWFTLVDHHHVVRLNGRQHRLSFGEIFAIPMGAPSDGCDALDRRTRTSQTEDGELGQEHRDLESRPADIGEHVAHRVKLRAQLHAHIDKWRHRAWPGDYP
jgi:hypothetical protein